VAPTTGVLTGVSSSIRHEFDVDLAAHRLGVPLERADGQQVFAATLAARDGAVAGAPALGDSFFGRTCTRSGGDELVGDLDLGLKGVVGVLEAWRGRVRGELLVVVDDRSVLGFGHLESPRCAGAPSQHACGGTVFRQQIDRPRAPFACAEQQPTERRRTKPIVCWGIARTPGAYRRG